MKHLVYVPILAAMLSLSYVSLSADSPSRPTGVAAENWIPVSERLGLVLLPGETAAAGQRDPAFKREDGTAIPLGPRDMPLLLKPPVGGYFMVKGASGWTRLVVVEPVKGPADAG